MPGNYITRASYERVHKQIVKLREKEIPKISQEKLEAASQGDLSENAGYEYAKQKLEQLQNRVLQLEASIADVQFIEDLPIPGTVVSLGTTVKVQDLGEGKEETYTILGPADADAAKGVISFQSPIARGMITKKVGDEAKIALPDGSRTVKILDIQKYAR